MRTKKVLWVGGFVLLLIAAGIAPTVVSGAAKAPVSNSVQITTDPHYDRNPSVFQANDGSYWLFFTRAINGGVRGVNNYDPDLDFYNVYYKRASSLAGLRTAPEHALPTTAPPLDNAQRDVAALQSRDGTIWVFTSTGLGPGAQRSVYYYTYVRGHWSGPTAVPNTDYAAHIDAVENHGAIWVFFDVGYSLYATKFDKGVWQTPTLIAADATLGKGIVDDGTFYVVWSHVDASQNVWGDYIGLSTSRDGKTWKTVGPVAKWPDSGLTNWDPVIIKDKNSFRLFWAPSDTEQFIATSTSKNPTDANSWSAPVRVTTASSGGNSWWDFWPQPIKSEGGICLLYTSERNSLGTGMSDGNIWMLMPAPSAHDNR